jgi:hypothetical protein
MFSGGIDLIPPCALVRLTRGQLGVVDNAAEALTAEFIDNGFIKQIAEDRLLSANHPAATRALKLLQLPTA